MADTFGQFSCSFNLGSAEHAAAAEAIWDELAAEMWRDEDEGIGFEIEGNMSNRTGEIWIYSDGYGVPDHVVRFVLRCAEALNLSGRWGFAWSYSCSRPQINAFCGAAVVIDLGSRKVLEKLDCLNWVQDRRASTDSADAATAAGTPS